MSIDVKSFVLSILGEKQVSQLTNDEFAVLLSEVFCYYENEQSKILRNQVSRSF